MTTEFIHNQDCWKSNIDSENLRDINDYQYELNIGSNAPFECDESPHEGLEAIRKHEECIDE
jgi:hypothetical protein